MILHEARRRAPASAAEAAIILDLAVVIIVLIAVPMVQVLDRTQSAAILRVTNFNPAIHILQFDPRASTGQLAAQVVSHEAMIVNMQAEVVINPA